jgi:hypothetical protein
MDSAKGRALDLEDAVDYGTKGTFVIAAICWLVALAALVDLLLGNQGAINGVVGAGFGAVIMTVTACWMRRQDHRSTPGA